jgi:ribosomal-protein-alanine N-acetyltransferase
MPLPTLQTPRLVLRPFELADAPVVQRLAGVPEVALTTQNIPHPYEDGMAESWIGTLAPEWEAGRFLTLAVTTAEHGLVGAVGLHLNAAHRRGELGYWIGLPYWGKGYATEASRALLDHGFGPLVLNRIQARHMTRNPASGRVMRKLGMKPEGVQRQHVLVRGTFEDVAVYAILRGDRDDVLSRRAAAAPTPA